MYAGDEFYSDDITSGPLAVEYHDDPPIGAGACVTCGRDTTGTILNYDGIGSGWRHLCRANTGCQR